MEEHPPARKAFESSVSAFLIHVCAIACFIPPLSTTLAFLASPLYYVALGLAIAVTHVLLVIYIYQTADRLGRSPLPWVIVSAILPVLGGLLSLLVLGSFGKDLQWEATSVKTA